MASPDDSNIEAYYHSALEACAHASQLEANDRSTDALTEYRRSIALIDAMRQLARDPLRDTDEAYFAGVDDVEGICKVHIAKLEGDLPPAALEVPLERGPRRRKSSDSVNTLGRGGLTRAGSVPPRKEAKTPERSRRARVAERTKVSRSPSPEKKEKKSLPFSLRNQGPVLTRVSSADSANIPLATASASAASQAAVEASRAATLAWQGKKPNGEPKKPRNPSPTSSRAGSLDINSTKRSSIGDSASLLDAPLIDFSTPVMSTSAPNVSQEVQTWMPLSPAPTPPPQPPQSSYVESQPAPRRKQQHPPSKSLGRSNAHIIRPPKPTRPPPPPAHPRSTSAPDLAESVQRITEVPPISVTISEDISPEEELSREEKALKELKGVDENLAKTILNEIVVKGDEVQWDDIAGLDEAKTSLKETVIYPFLRPDLFSGLREPARGMLLFGPPGTGKTMLARAVATQAKSTFFSVSASTLVSKYLGESEKLVRALFTLAKALSPSIIFVDEIDSLLTSRSGGENENEASRRLKTEFLIQWSSLASAAAARTNEESPRVLVLAATNLPWAIDDAARRRFVLRQYIPLPEADTRRVQFRTLLSRQHHTLTDEQLEQLVSMTDGFSGSDITALTKDAAMGPLRSLGEALLTTKREEIRPIGFDDFVTSLRKIRPSVSKESLRAFEKWNDEFGSKG